MSVVELMHLSSAVGLTSYDEQQLRRDGYHHPLYPMVVC